MCATGSIFVEEKMLILPPIEVKEAFTRPWKMKVFAKENSVLGRGTWTKPYGSDLASFQSILHSFLFFFTEISEMIVFCHFLLPF